MKLIKVSLHLSTKIGHSSSANRESVTVLPMVLRAGSFILTIQARFMDYVETVH